jgi:hypothetical protein
MENQAEKSAYRPVRCSRELDETLGRLAAQRHTSKSEVLRDLVDRGLVSIGAKADEDYLASLVRQAVDEALKPQVERLAAITAKATHISGAAFFMSIFAATQGRTPAEQRQITEAAGTARELGIQYLKLKDRDIDAFLKVGAKRMVDESESTK